MTTLRKLDVRMKAREYAAAQLLGQDEPDWAEEAGVPRELMTVFMDELARIAHRIERTVKPANRTRSPQ